MKEQNKMNPKTEFSPIAPSYYINQTHQIGIFSLPQTESAKQGLQPTPRFNAIGNTFYEPLTGHKVIPSLIAGVRLSTDNRNLNTPLPKNRNSYHPEDHETQSCGASTSSSFKTTGFGFSD